jgi:hypothetical protein
MVGVHYMAHGTNLAMQTLSKLLLVSRLEGLFQTLHSYSNMIPKHHLEFHKLVKIMETKGN